MSERQWNRPIVVGAKWKFGVGFSEEYITALVALSEKIPMPAQKEIATAFVALETEVGHWHAFWHFKFITTEQYAEIADLSPAKILERARYGDELVQWWGEVGYPFIRGGRWKYRTHLHTDEYPADCFEQYHRASILHARGNAAEGGKRYNIGKINNAFRRTLNDLAAWAQERHPDDEVLAGRLQGHYQCLRQGRRKDPNRRCFYRNRGHVGQSCILCAFPAPWSMVEDRDESSSPLIAIGVRRGSRSKDGARSLEVPRYPRLGESHEQDGDGGG